jgi:hypothetical protein
MKILDRAPAASRTDTRPGTGATPNVSCPDCGRPAWIDWRDEVNSTSGPVVHVKVRCVDRHWFLMPEGWLTSTPA